MKKAIQRLLSRCFAEEIAELEEIAVRVAVDFWLREHSDEMALTAARLGTVTEYASRTAAELAAARAWMQRLRELAEKKAAEVEEMNKGLRSEDLVFARWHWGYRAALEDAVRDMPEAQR